MLFTFIIPVYKVEKYLYACVKSILNQSYQNIEIILVDDGSPDKCPQICDDLSLHDKRIKVIHKQNGGLSSARNEGLKNANGEYIIFLDSDDWWADNRAAERIAYTIEQYSPDVVLFSGKKYYTNDGKYSGNSTHLDVFNNSGLVDIEQLMKHSAFLACAWDKVIKRSVLKEKNIEFQIGQLSEDIEWCCKLILLDLKFAVTTGDIHVYRQQNSTSITSNITNKNLCDIKHTIVKYADLAQTYNCKPLLHFLALEYLLWLAITPYLEGHEGQEMKKEMKRYFWLLNYSWYPRVKTVRAAKFLGYNVITNMLSLVFKAKRHKI